MPWNKTELRRVALQQRCELPQNVWQYSVKQIIQRALQEIDWQAVRSVHTYLPIVEQHEIDTWLLIKQLRSLHPQIEIVVPRIVNSTTLQSVVLHEDMPLQQNRWGIWEPDEKAEQFADQAIDLVIIPMLGFDQRGYRVGYGKGFYDRFLQDCRKDVLKVGLSLFPAVDHIEDVHQFDLRLDCCVLPDQTVWWSSSALRKVHSGTRRDAM